MFFQSLLPNFNIQEFAAPVPLNDEGANQVRENNAVDAPEGEGEKFIDFLETLDLTCVNDNFVLFC